MKKIFYSATLMGLFLGTNVGIVNAAEFPDVSSDRWSYDSIEYIADKGLISGYEDGKFYPERNITRAEAAVVINNYLIEEDRLTEEASSNNFKDVPSGAWYTQAVNNIASLGIFKGDTDGNFNPNNELTRAEMVAIFNRVEGYEKKADYQFSDVEDTDWYAEDVKIAYSNGIVNGIEQSNGHVIFSGDQDVKREEFAKVLNNVYHYNPSFVANEIPTVISPEEEALQEVFNIINLEREKVGVAPLVMNDSLSKVAAMDAENMALRNEFISSTDEFEEMLNSYGLNPVWAFQTYASGDEGEIASTLIDYLSTTEHFKQLMNSTLEEVGIGWYAGEDNINYLVIVVANF